MAEMIGKVLYKLIYLFFVCDLVFASDSVSKDLLLKVKNSEPENFLLFEKDFDLEFKAYLLNKNKQCIDPEYLAGENTDQSRCFEELKNIKKQFIDIKFAKKNKILTESFNQMKSSLNNVYQSKLKSIQNSSPEDSLFFEF